MKYVKINTEDKLEDLSERVGIQNVDQILADNGLDRKPSIGKLWKTKCDEVISNSNEITPQRKISILNKFVDNSDIYEMAALSDDNNWKLLSSLKSFKDYLYISDSLESSVPDSYDILGNKESVSASIFNKVKSAILNNQVVDSSIFGSVSTIRGIGLIESKGTNEAYTNPLDWFKIPQDKIVLYSSIAGYGVSIPAYPEEISDSRSADYTTMPDLLYQYEPWQMYQGSGPRSITYEFNLHRDMWTGDHSDGMANNLIRFCQAQCYPLYRGSAVHTPLVTLYINGANVITGVMTNVDVQWSGPLGQADDWYLAFKLSFSITEVSQTALNYSSVIQKPLIG